MVIRISRNESIFLIMFLALLEPEYFSRISILDSAYTAIQVVCIAYTFLYCIMMILRNRQYSKNSLIFCMLITLFLFIYVVSTYMNDANVGYALRKLILNMGYIFLAFWIFSTDLKAGLRMLRAVLVAYISINFIIEVVVPNGLYYSYVNGSQYLTHWFLGAKNNMILYFVPGLMVEFIYEKTIGARARGFYLLSIVCLLSSIIASSATSIIAILMLTTFGIIFNKIKNIPVFNMGTVLIGSYVLTYLFVFSTVFMSTIEFVSNFFGKSQLLSGRLNIWARALLLIQESPFLGYGYETETVLVQKFRSSYATHCHNLYLDVLYKTGIVGSIVLIVIFLILAREYKNKVSSFVKSMCVVTMAVYTCIMFLMEAYFDLGLFYFIMVMAFYYGEGLNENSSNAERML